MRQVPSLTARGFVVVALSRLVMWVFSCRSQSKRIAVAVLILIGLVASSYALENTAAKRLGLIPLLYIHAILPILICSILLLNPCAMRRLFHRNLGSV